MKLIYKFSDDQIKQLHALYQNEWWTKGRSLEDTYKVVKGSALNVGLIDENENLKGYVRVITDSVFKAFIYDLIIAEDSRKDGLSRMIMEAILGDDLIKNVGHIELYCVDPLVPYYEMFGFTPDVGPIKLMRKKALQKHP